MNSAVEKFAFQRWRSRKLDGSPMPKIRPATSLELSNRIRMQTDQTIMTTEQNLTEGVVVERTFDAPVARVWKALTDVKEMREWYFDLKEFKAEVGFEFEFVVEHEGTTYHHLCKVTEVIPQKKIAYTWRYKGHEGDSLVTFELAADGNKTRLKLTHEGLETFPKTPAFARENFNQGWISIAAELERFLEVPGDMEEFVISRT